MSRRNAIRGPTSALTDFLRESGINHETIQRRVRTREVPQPQPQPVAGPSNTAQTGEPSNAVAVATDGYGSDDLDEAEEKPAKRRKLSKAAEAKLKAKQKANQKKKSKKDGDEDDDDSDDELYNALSKMRGSENTPKPPIGSFDNCARCEKQFTVTKYTMAANPPPGFLCHECAKASGTDPFKKPAAPKKRKVPADKRTVVNFEERHFPSLASMCIDLISSHINDVEALGDIGGLSMDKIAKAISRNRSLTPENAVLFYDVRNIDLTLYDVTNLTPPALCALASLNPNLTNLRLDFCGRMDDTVATAWCTSLPNLKRIELLGPFLVRVPTWQAFFKAHPLLEGFLITQSPRFDLECMSTLVESCKNLKELRLKEIGKMDTEFVTHLKKLSGNLTYLDLSRPGIPEALSEASLIELMGAIGKTLMHLDLSGNVLITDAFLFQGLKPNARQLNSLVLSDVTKLTDAGVAEFFQTWNSAAEQAQEAPNPPLSVIDMSRDHELASLALTALLQHSGSTLITLNINGWKAVSEAALKSIAEHTQELQKLDMGWCREVDNWVIKSIMENCSKIKEVKVWGCQRLTDKCPRKRHVAIHGVQL